MAYIDSLLASGERPIKREHQHWFILVANAAYGILALVAAILLLFISGNLGQGFVKDVLGWVIVIIVVGGLGYLAWESIRWTNREFVVTTRRVLQMEGVINKKVSDSSLEKINDAVLSQSVFGRMFDFGDLTVLTASESGIEKMRMLRSPVVYKKKMLDAKHDYEVDMERAGWAPSPPIRDGSTAAPTPGAPLEDTTATPAPAQAQAAAPPARAPRADPDEVTRTLASLADLRDRGAISPDEYERKKTELLTRL